MNNVVLKINIYVVCFIIDAFSENYFKAVFTLSVCFDNLVENCNLADFGWWPEFYTSDSSERNHSERGRSCSSPESWKRFIRRPGRCFRK